jgi:hypothetical protein
MRTGASLALALSSSALLATTPAVAGSFRLPWQAGASQYLTQDANDKCCSDHIGANRYAYDFAFPTGGAFDVVAPADGTIVHVKMSSDKGCGSAACVSDANYIVIDHGDGTQTTMLHLAHASLDPAVVCGKFVRRGQHLATTGSTGWSTGVHLHVERDQVKPSLSKTCECGPDGLGCALGAVEWNLFWPSSQMPNVPVAFDEWRNAADGDGRRGLIGPSRNADDGGEIVTLTVDGKTSAAEANLAPGIYQVWALVPLGGTSARTIQVLEAGPPNAVAQHTVQGSLGDVRTGGAFQPVRGLEHVVLDGAARFVVGASDLAATGATDRGMPSTILLRKLALDEPVPAKTDGVVLPVQGAQMGVSGQGGGALALDDGPGSGPGLRDTLLPALAIGGAGLVISAARRRRRKS